MAGEDVTATIGGDASPLQRVLADVQSAAKKTGETIGLELGTRRQAGEEMRMQRGLDMFLRSLSGATDPVTAFTGAIEGLGRAFRVVGPLMIAVGIGGFLYEQFSKASEGAKKLSDELLKTTEVNPATQSLAELKRQVESFDKLEEKYNDRGMLEKIIMGANGGNALHQMAVELNELKKTTLELDEAAKEAALSEAKLLEAGTNPGDQKRGAALRQQIAAQDDQRGAQDRLDLAKKQETKHQQELAAIDKELEDRRSSSRRGSRKQNAETEIEAEIAGRRANAAKALDRAKQTISYSEKALANYRATAQADAIKSGVVDNSEMMKSSEEVGRVMAERQQLAFNEIYDSKTTVGEKAGLLRGKIDTATAQAVRNAPLQTQLQKQEALKQIEQDRLKLNQLLNEATTKQGELAQRQVDLGLERAEAQKDLARAQVDAMGFTGEVSSLRRQGFAGGIGSNHNQAQLKVLEESRKHLAKIETAAAKLAAKEAEEGA